MVEQQGQIIALLTKMVPCLPMQPPETIQQPALSQPPATSTSIQLPPLAPYQQPQPTIPPAISTSIQLPPLTLSAQPPSVPPLFATAQQPQLGDLETTESDSLLDEIYQYISSGEDSNLTSDFNYQSPSCTASNYVWPSFNILHTSTTFSNTTKTTICI